MLLGVFHWEAKASPRPAWFVIRINFSHVSQFCDHYSYSALAYFVLIKPLVVLFSTIVLVALFPIALVLIPLLPIYLRAARVWGKYQAHVAMENL